MKLICGILIFWMIGCGFLHGQKPPKLWHGKERSLRYQPEGQGFVIENGTLRYNKALYGINSSFRVETSDVPVLGLYMPYMGGNLQWGVRSDKGSKWLVDADYVRSVYEPGIRRYEIKDALLGKGQLLIEVLAMADANGVVVRLSGKDLPPDLRLMTMYGGADSQRFFRNADLGVDVANAFDLKPDACLGNDYQLEGTSFTMSYGQDSRNPTSVTGSFSPETLLRLGSPYSVERPSDVWESAVTASKPVLLAEFPAGSNEVHYLALKNAADGLDIPADQLHVLFDMADERRKEVASAVVVDTPDPYMNPIGGVLSTAADGIWDDVWLHGAIGWRMPLNGWRAGYTGDFIGLNARNRRHFNRYAASQVTDVPPVMSHPAPDSALNLARPLKKWGTPMYSNGYICRNPESNRRMHHYNMNLVFIDALLWHLNWTGDLDYAREVWPVITRHLEWEKRNYDPDNDGLYDACASIWASDALYYNSGAVTHSSAYNYRAFRMAALIAEKIGVDGTAYKQESEKILKALNERLWLEEEGHWAEFQDFMGKGLLHTRPGLWTIYHAIDSEVHDPFQGYQATRYIDTQIPHIPVLAKGLEDKGYYTLSTTNWFPYSWSINNVAFAEVAHTALAYWQSGRHEKASKLFKSIVLDGMYLGSSPGNIGQISFYDAARGECYRDFGDPVGMYSRALIEGLYGIKPDLLNRQVHIQPGFPSDWEHASLTTSYLDFKFERAGLRENYEITSSMDAAEKILLELRAFGTTVKALKVNGQDHNWQWIEAVGGPRLMVEVNSREKIILEIDWDQPLGQSTEVKELQHAAGDMLEVNMPARILEVKDPQGALKDFSFRGKRLRGDVQGNAGAKTLFIKVQEAGAVWWQPLHLEVRNPFSFEYDREASTLQLRIRNQTAVTQSLELAVNPGPGAWSQKLKLLPDEWSPDIEVPVDHLYLGTNRVELRIDKEVLFSEDLSLWSLKVPTRSYEMVAMDELVNASVSAIFDEVYLSPRSPFTTLQIPVQGIGEWCHPKLTADIDDSGLRAAVSNGVFTTPFGLPFYSIEDPESPNVLFVSLWDNYPDRAEVPLNGKAAHAYLLMAGSTNHMQSHFVNGKVRVQYTDGSESVLDLVNPDNWVPIEQDLFIDDFAFQTVHARPYRVALKTGEVSRDMEQLMGINPAEVYGRSIDGGAGIILDLPLDPEKELKALVLEAVANEVVIGLMGVTLVR
jgi:hypothetical protein